MSTNDAVSALFWMLMCDVRGRPMPGSAPAGSMNSFGLTLDLRHNGLPDPRLSEPVSGVAGELFGNAAWCIHVEGTDSTEAAPLPQADRAKDPTAVLRHAAHCIRSYINAFRQCPERLDILLQVTYDQAMQSTKSRIDTVARMTGAQDAFITSWQFPFWSADFGEGGPVRYKTRSRIKMHINAVEIITRSFPNVYVMWHNYHGL